MRINLIVAKDESSGIGYLNELPWALKGDLAHFRKVTSDVPENDVIQHMNVVIMGRKTWMSLPFRPLKNRINIILSGNPEFNIDQNDYVYKASSWNDIYQIVMTLDGKLVIDNKILKINEIFAIGGYQIYNEVMQNQYCNKIYITEIYAKYETDVKFPAITNDFNLIDVSPFQNDIDIKSGKQTFYRFFTYQHTRYCNNYDIVDETICAALSNLENYTKTSDKETQELFLKLKNKLLVVPVFQNNEENQYLTMLNDIVTNGIDRSDRTGVGTRSVFGRCMKFDLSDTFPLNTTKRMFLRGIFTELMLYLRGQTDNTILQKQNVHIWDANTTRAFLDKRGLTHFAEGDMGATYGFNFRYYGANYEGCDKDYTGQGFDQLQYVIDLIKTDPTSRRIIINLWNPTTLNQVALPSCLCMYQFYVNTELNKLNLNIYIRSSDVFLAYNWNTCTGALFVHMLCNTEGINLTPGELTVMSGDTHIYSNHMDAVKENLTRKPYPYPKLVINNKRSDIKDFEWSDISLFGYKSLSSIPAPLAV